jgi:alpha-tubulin suppressor-like RCC1 family protein
VEVLDAHDARVANAAGTVTIRIGTNPGGGTLRGASTAGVVNGVATFSDLAIDKAGTGYTLLVSLTGLTSATSAPFNVVPGPAVTMAFSAQPGNGTGGLPFRQQPTLQLHDSVGNLSDALVAVTLSLQGGRNGARLSGTLVRTAVAGVAAFTDLSVDSASAGYLLVANVPGLPSTTSTAFSVSVGPPSPWTSTVEAVDTLLMSFDTMRLTVTTRDAGGNRLTVGGYPVSIVGAPGTGQTLDVGDGTYSYEAISGSEGIVTPTAVVQGAATTTLPPQVRTEVFVQVSTGGQHSCALAYSGFAYCWGLGERGQLGNGLSESSLLPVRVAGNHGWAWLTAGGEHTCGLTTFGEVWCWSSNARTALGIGLPDPGNDRSTPARVAGNLSFLQVSAGLGEVTCATSTTSEAYCWGRNDYGQLGDGTTMDRSAPTRVAMDPQDFVSSTGAGVTHSCAAVPDDPQGVNTRCWGSDSAGALGDGSGPLSSTCNGQPCSLVPVPVPKVYVNLFGVRHAFSIGVGHTCATGLGSSACWGDNSSGQFGNGTTVSSDTVVVVSPFGPNQLNPLSAVEAGPGFSCGVLTSYTLACWGDNSFGQLGDGTTIPTSVPATIGTALLGWDAAIDAGLRHACSLSGGAVACWGENLAGQLGDGSTTPRLTPVRIRLKR